MEAPIAVFSLCRVESVNRAPWRHAIDFVVVVDVPVGGHGVVDRRGVRADRPRRNTHASQERGQGARHVPTLRVLHGLVAARGVGPENGVGAAPTRRVGAGAVVSVPASFQETRGRETPVAACRQLACGRPRIAAIHRKGNREILEGLIEGRFVELPVAPSHHVFLLPRDQAVFGFDVLLSLLLILVVHGILR